MEKKQNPGVTSLPSTNNQVHCRAKEGEREHLGAAAANQGSFEGGSRRSPPVPVPRVPATPLTFQEADPGPGLRQAGQQGVEDDLGCAVLLQLLPVARVLVQHHHGRQASGPRRPLGSRQQPRSGRRVGHHEVQRHGPAAGPPHHHRVEVDVERAAEAGGRVGQVGPAVQHQAAGGLLPQQLPQLAAVEGRDFHAGRGSRPAAAGAGAEKAEGGCPVLARSRRRWDGTGGTEAPRGRAEPGQGIPAGAAGHLYEWEAGP